jgi:hypothetical protein
MSGGMKITDHQFFGGSGSPRFPVGNKLKSESSAEGAGNVAKYEDTTEAIKGLQTAGIRKAESHKMKDGNRN